MVVGRDESGSGLFDYVCYDGFSFLRCAAGEDDFGAVGFCGGDFGWRGYGGHDDGCGNAQSSCSERESLRMVS